MGHFAFKDNMRFFIEGGKVYNVPGGAQLPRDPETLEFVPDMKISSVSTGIQTPEPTLAKPAEPEETYKGAMSISGLKGEGVEEEPAKEEKAVHSASCKSLGRGGRYTPNCPKCEELKENK